MAAQGVAARLIRLRYAGTCRSCDALLDVGTKAEFDAATKTVRCTSCLDHAAPGAPTVLSVEPIDALEAPSTADHAAQELERGIAGHSARREHERRRTKRDDAIRSAHPRSGRLILAVSEEPQSTTAWARGAVGEEKRLFTIEGVVGV